MITNPIDDKALIDSIVNQLKPDLTKAIADVAAVGGQVTAVSSQVQNVGDSVSVETGDIDNALISTKTDINTELAALKAANEVMHGKTQSATASLLNGVGDFYSMHRGNGNQTIPSSGSTAMDWVEYSNLSSSSIYASNPNNDYQVAKYKAAFENMYPSPVITPNELNTIASVTGSGVFNGIFFPFMRGENNSNEIELQIIVDDVIVFDSVAVVGMGLREYMWFGDFASTTHAFSPHFNGVSRIRVPKFIGGKAFFRNLSIKARVKTLTDLTDLDVAESHYLKRFYVDYQLNKW